MKLICISASGRNWFLPSILNALPWNHVFPSLSVLLSCQTDELHLIHNRRLLSLINISPEVGHVNYNVPFSWVESKTVLASDLTTWCWQALWFWKAIIRMANPSEKTNRMSQITAQRTHSSKNHRSDRIIYHIIQIPFSISEKKLFFSSLVHLNPPFDSTPISLKRFIMDFTLKINKDVQKQWTM